MTIVSKKSKFIMYVILIIGAIFVIYPFFFMIMNSFKTGVAIMNTPNSLPTSLNLEGYKAVFTQLHMLRLFANSIFIAVSVTILSTFFSAMVAYAITRTDLPYKKTILGIILGSLMIPGVLLMIPSFLMMYHWGWVNTYAPLIIPGCISAYNIFLMIQFMKGIDNAFVEAARIDGASDWYIFWHIILPMCKPALATIAILVFIGSWNDFMNPLLYLRSQSLMTVQLAVYNFQSSIPGQHVEQVWAAYTVVTVPIVIVFLFLQKQFMKAFGNAGLK